MAYTVITDASHPAAAALADRLRAAGGQVVSNTEDISTKEGVRALLEKTGVPDNLVISGYAGARATLSGDAEAIITAARQNILSGFAAARHFGSAMAERGGGCVLFLSSTCALSPFGADYAYSLSQGALLMMQRELSLFLGNLGIRVNTVLAAPMEEESARFDSEYLAVNYDIGTKSPLHRAVTGDEIACACEFLLSPAASGINGAEIRVDGGLVRYYLDRTYGVKKEADLP